MAKPPKTSKILWLNHPKRAKCGAVAERVKESNLRSKGCGFESTLRTCSEVNSRALIVTA